MTNYGANNGNNTSNFQITEKSNEPVLKRNSNIFNRPNYNNNPGKGNAKPMFTFKASENKNAYNDKMPTSQMVNNFKPKIMYPQQGTINEKPDLSSVDTENLTYGADWHS